MKIAFYKGTKTGLSGIYNKGVRWIEDGSYSHCELLFSNGLSASSSFMDGGVRVKYIDYNKHPEDWDIVDIPWADEKLALSYFKQRLGLPYNIKGNIRFIFGFVGGNSEGEFCSESCAGAIGLESPWKYAPNQLYEVVSFINQLYEGSKMNLFVDSTLPVDEPPVEDDPTGHGDVPPKTKPPTGN